MKRDRWCPGHLVEAEGGQRAGALGRGRSSPPEDWFEQCESRDGLLVGMPRGTAVWAGTEGRRDPMRESLRVSSTISRWQVVSSGGCLTSVWKAS